MIKYLKESSKYEKSKNIYFIDCGCNNDNDYIFDQKYNVKCYYISWNEIYNRLKIDENAIYQILIQ